MAGSSIDEVQTLLDDHVIKTQTMKGSPYAAEFKERLEDWEKYLTGVQDVVDVWLKATKKTAVGGGFGCRCRACGSIWSPSSVPRSASEAYLPFGGLKAMWKVAILQRRRRFKA